VGSYRGAFGRIEFDVTDALRSGKNRLVLYHCTPAPGFKLDGIDGSAIPTGGQTQIASQVYLTVRSAVSIASVHARPNAADGSIRTVLTVRNLSGTPATATITARVREYGEQACSDRAVQSVSVDRGESIHEIELCVPDCRLWSVDEPVLYDLTLTLACGDEIDEVQERIGFKDLRVDEKGYFRLNGKRIYLKCTHTNLHQPGTQGTARDVKQYYQLLVYLKACGFNCVRYLRTAAMPELLRMCDEIGLLVYEEHQLSWLKKDCDQTDRLFTESVTEILARDRNHVSFGIFGMLNETKAEGDTEALFRAAVNCLPEARRVAPDLLFLLSSGRWDGYLNLASASNPGSDKWDALMGAEGADNHERVTNMVWSWMPGLGDAHYYPYFPIGSDARKDLAAIAAYPRAVLLSETGMGSQSNIIGEYLRFATFDYSPYGSAYSCLKRQVAAYRDFYRDYGLDRIWATPEAALEATQEYQARQRAAQITMIRRVEGYNGYSLTMSHDAGFRGEGIMEQGNYYKPGMTEMLQDQLRDLRFCITAEKTHLSCEEELDLEVVLSDIDVLKQDRDYEVTVRIVGRSGTVWSKQITVRKGEGVILPVLHEHIPLKGWQNGRYTVGAEIAEGAYATCGSCSFYLTDYAALPRLTGKVGGVGLCDEISGHLTGAGATVVSEFTAEEMVGKAVFVGDTELSDTQRDALFAMAEQGAHLVFLAPWRLVRAEDRDDSYRSLPYVIQTKNEAITMPIGPARLFKDAEWLYHHDSVVFDSPLTRGLQSECIWDAEYYDDVFDPHLISGAPVPEELGIASFFAGMAGPPEREFSCGYKLGRYGYGKGSVTLSTLKLSAPSPVARAILINLADRG